MTIGRYGSIAVLALILVMGSMPAAGADSPAVDRIQKTGVLKVGMSGGQAPMNFKDRSGKLRGLEVDIADMLATIMDVKLQLVEKPFPELLPALKAGEVDMVMSGLTITLDRADDFSFVGPYMISGKSILTRSKLLAQADETNDINREDLKVAVLENSNSQSYVERYIPDVKIVPCKDYDSAIKMVIDGDVAALLADMPVCVISLARYPDAGLETLPKPLTIEPFGIAVQSSDTRFLNLIENYYRTLQNMGLLDSLKTKWLESTSWIPSLP